MCVRLPSPGRRHPLPGLVCTTLPAGCVTALCACWRLLLSCRAYHERCVDPPLVLADIPEDEGWLCPACDTKVGGAPRPRSHTVFPLLFMLVNDGSAEKGRSQRASSTTTLDTHLRVPVVVVCCVQADILQQVNDFFGCDYELDTKWSDLFKEPAELQEAMRMSRLRSGSLPTSPRALGKAGRQGGVGSLEAAVAAVMQQQQHWPASGGGRKKQKQQVGGGDMQRKPSATLQQLHGDLADSDSEDESYSEQESGE